MSKKYTTNFLEDTNGSTGSANQVLVSTAAGIDWVDGSDSGIIGGPYLPLSAGSSYPLTGVLYIAGTIRNSSGDLEIRNQTASGFATATKLKQQTTNGLETFLTLDGTSGNAYFTNQGNVGIGTTSPSAKLDIVGTASSDYAPLTPVTLIGKTASGTGWAGTDVLTGYTHTPGNSDSLVTDIVPTANTKYQVTFTVSGITAGRFDFINFGGTAVSIYAGSNRTATISFITGNTNPLEITAQSATAGTISIDSVVSVGARDSVTNIRNSSGVIVNHIRTGATSGSIYVGLEAGQSLPGTTSLSNTAIGFRALKNNLQGGYNTVIGYGNAQNSFASSYITAIGHNIFASLKRTGNVYSTAVGTNIGASSSFMGTGNVLMGNNILLTATTAGNNIALGYNTMRNATTGSNNIGLGASTLLYNTTGGNNVSLGTLSLTNLTTGSSNIAIGYGAGRYAGGSTTSLTVANDSTFIGYNSRPNGDSQTNQIVIGHNAIGAGSNSATIGSTTISKTILNGNVGIGTTSPTSGIDVNTSQQAARFVSSQATGLEVQGGGNSQPVARFLDTAASEKVTISSTGYVGIGTTSPTVPFEVISNNNTAARFYRPGNRTTVKIDSDAGRTSSLLIAQGNVIQYYVGMPTQAVSGLGSRFAISYKGAPNFTMTGSNGTIGINTTSANLQSGGEGIHVNSSDDNSEIKFTNSTTGATASDGTALVASGSGFVINNREAGNLTLGTNNTTRVLINSIGKVGIGTTNPQEKLDVKGALKVGAELASNNIVVNGGDASNLASITSRGNGISIATGTAFGVTHIKLLPGGSGNVGVGTTSPTSRLGVSGGDIEVEDIASGIIMKSPDGTRYRVTIANGGTLSVAAV